MWRGKQRGCLEKKNADCVFGLRLATDHESACKRMTNFGTYTNAFEIEHKYLELTAMVVHMSAPWSQHSHGWMIPIPAITMVACWQTGITLLAFICVWLYWWIQKHARICTHDKRVICLLNQRSLCVSSISGESITQKLDFSKHHIIPVFDGSSPFLASLGDPQPSLLVSWDTLHGSTTAHPQIGSPALSDLWTDH